MEQLAPSSKCDHLKCCRAILWWALEMAFLCVLGLLKTLFISMSHIIIRSCFKFSKFYHPAMTDFCFSYGNRWDFLIKSLHRVSDSGQNLYFFDHTKKKSRTPYPRPQILGVNCKLWHTFTTAWGKTEKNRSYKSKR